MLGWFFEECDGGVDYVFFVVFVVEEVDDVVV